MLVALLPQASHVFHDVGRVGRDNRGAILTVATFVIGNQGCQAEHNPGRERAFASEVFFQSRQIPCGELGEGVQHDGRDLMVYKRVGEPFHHTVGKRPEFFPWQVYRFDEFVEHHFADIPPHVRILTGLTHDVYAGKIGHGGE